jgi:hypothetical protein
LLAKSEPSQRFLAATDRILDSPATSEPSNRRIRVEFLKTRVPEPFGMADAFISLRSTTAHTEGDLVMLRTTIAAGVVACALAAAPSASAQGFRLNIGVGPSYGVYGPSYYGGGRFYDQRYYGDWRDYRGDYWRRPHYDYHRYPFPHYDLHWGRHGHHHYGHHRHGGHRHR